MKFFCKPIFTGFAPNLTTEDVKIACGFLFLPWRWQQLRKGVGGLAVEKWLTNYFKIKYVYTFDSGRSALYFALKSLALSPGDEVIVQAYTCIVVINAIQWNGAKPIFVDINNDFNLNFDDLQHKITDKTKAIIVQHTFGKPSDVEKINILAKKNNIKVIEDCAHALGAKAGDKQLGTLGDIGIFSFGADKVISCVRGGALITNNDELSKKITDYQSQLQPTNILKVIQHLMHYLLFSIGKPLYNLEIGKGILAIGKSLNLMNKIVYDIEKQGQSPSFYPALLPNSLATILLGQLKNLATILEHRQAIALEYNKLITNHLITKPEWSDDSVWLRYPLLIKNPDKLFYLAKKQGIILGNWYDTPVAPKDIDLSKTGYTLGICPKAEELAKMSINLPTDFGINLSDAKRIITMLNNYE